MHLFDVDGYLLWVPESRSPIVEDLLNGVWTAISNHVRHEASRCAQSMRALYNRKALFDDLASMCTTISLARRGAELKT